MNLSDLLEESIKWLAWGGLGLLLITVIAFLFRWGFKFRLVGATVFTFLLSVSCWAFTTSYRPPVEVIGAKYAPVVYDNGFDLVVAQAQDDFPNEAIKPSLDQLAGNLKGGGRNGSLVHVRIRKVDNLEDGINKPIILGEAVRDVRNNITIENETFLSAPLESETTLNETIESETISNE